MIRSNDLDDLFSGVSRREFLKTAVTVTAAAALNVVPMPGAEVAAAAPASLIDTNVYLGQWPFRHEELFDTPMLVRKFREQGVTQAWVGSFDALLHKDISTVNARLAEEVHLHGEGLLVPIGTVNPMLTGWEEDLRRCVEVHRMPGIRLHPNYHRYKLTDPVFERMLKLADERQLFLQIPVIMEDARTIHPLVNVPATDMAPLSDVLKKFSNVRVQLLNAFQTIRGEPLLSLAACGVRFEIATLEGVGGVATLIEKLPIGCLCFGSYAPFFYFESARLKLKESELAEVQMNAVCSENALRLLKRT